jgi:ABC-type sugar transport system permease subunit/ABC-type glycerol-3-phosphate transport system substrate-binding protein
MIPCSDSVGRVARFAVALAAVALVVFSFCWVFSRPFRKQQLARDQVQLTVLHWGDKSEDAIVAQLCKDFESLPENHDIKLLRINLGQAAAVNTKLQTMFAAGDPPDVFYLGYEKAGDLANKDLLADLDELIAQDKAAGIPTVDLDDYFPSVLRCFRYDRDSSQIGKGRLIALAKDFTTLGFYYNKDLFRRAGVPEPPKDDWTWDEFIERARAIAKLPDCYGADFVTWEAVVRVFLWTHGKDFTEDNWAHYTFADPQVQAVLEKLQGWFHKEQRTLVSAKTQLETLLEPFLAGNVGMAGPLGRWKCPTYRLIDKFDWDFAPLPHARGCKPRNGIFTTGWAIAKKSPRRQQGWRLIKYLNGARGQALMSKGGLAMPALKSVAFSPAFCDPRQKPANCHAFLVAAEYAEPIDWPAEPRYLHQLRVRMEDIFKMDKPAGPQMLRVAREWRENDDLLRQHYPPMPWARVFTLIAIPLLAAVLIAAALWWRRRPKGLAFGEELAGNLMVSPWVIGFAAFTAFPILMSLLLAFTKWSGLATLDHAGVLGFDNFRTLWRLDDSFHKALRITIWYSLLAVPTSQLAALLAAMLLNHDFKSIGVFRAVWYLPSVLAGVGMAVMWKWVFNHEHGLLKTVIDPFLPMGWHSPAWFEKDAETWGVPAFAIVNLWSIGGTMMIYLAGLKGISRDLYEAAELDGAVGWRKFVNVTLPMLSPVVLFNVIIAVIASFQVFTQAWVMTAGGPGDSTRFYVLYLYNRAFDFHDMGYASAMAWLLLLITLLLTLVLMRSSRRFVYYEALKA